jgi:hypothetical protein
MEQGAHRLERGTTFFNNKELMNKKNWTFNWEIDTIENNKKMCNSGPNNG